MSPLDQDAALAHGASQNGMPYAAPVGGVARHSDVAYEPELEGSTYQTAPITSLALARWSWAVVGLLIGTLLGFLSATGGGWKATATIQINNAQGDAQGIKTTGQTLQAAAASDSVLAIAVKNLNADPKFAAAGCPKQDKQSLGGAITPLWTTDSSLVSITATSPSSSLCAGYKATAVAKAVQTKIQNDAQASIDQLTTEVKAIIASEALGSSTSQAEIQRQGALGSAAGQRQSNELAAKQSVSVIDATVALPAGPDRNISALLGAAGGAFLGALAAVAAGAGRRKPHSPRELVALAPDLTVRTTVQAGELAGRVLETGRRSVVVLAMPDTRFAATQLAMAIAHHLRTHGATVAVVDRVSEFNPSNAAEDRLWALRRDVRRNIPANFQADLLVVVCGADEEALSLIAGQSDLLVSVVAKQRKSRLADIRRTVDAVRVSEPVVVLAR
ncbi:MAG TPA: hypothetical protein VI248_18595 [Kineosporiaceae bacterium]